ncbi:hypothetical protein [Pelagibacterium sediminicola]|uniref:hypothetical protein n=1 Tax=Pelagibacterium sediminicola TaxID=2248761 RepID=UPI0013005107|nr:hypothetical protein [Pelagibacterium sediminicola]
MAEKAIAQTKVCTKCGVEKPLINFWKAAGRPLGVCSHCKDCMRARNKKWRDKNKEHLRQYRLDNPEVFIAATKRWRERNPEKVQAIEARRVRDPAKRRAYNQEYWAANKERLSAENRKRYWASRDARLAYRAKWVEENPDIQRQWIERNREKVRAADRRRRSTPKGRIDDRMSSNIRQALRQRKGGRRWEKLVGYSLSDLMAHLERHFLDGMNWENVGEWHIDHVIPKSVFNYEDAHHIDFRRCWALDNLRPLWSTDNMKKSNKIDAPFQPSLPI